MSELSRMAEKSFEAQKAAHVADTLAKAKALGLDLVPMDKSRDLVDMVLKNGPIGAAGLAEQGVARDVKKEPDYRKMDMASGDYPVSAQEAAGIMNSLYNFKGN